MYKNKFYLLCATVFLCWVNYSIAGIGVATVGSDVACDFKTGDTKINDALNDLKNYSEIRLTTSETYQEYLDLSDRDIVIVGGYANCIDAANDIQSFHTNHSVIQPVQPSTQPVIKISGSMERNHVTLKNITIMGGTSSTFESAGGLNVAAADLQLTLNNVRIEQNQGRFGGGLSVYNGSTDVSAVNVYFKENSATLGGGGLNCSGRNNTVLMHNDERWDENSGIDFGNFYDNEVTQGDGGGALITDGCQFDFYGGRNLNSDSTDRRGFLYNTASLNGGGLAVTAGGVVRLFGHQTCDENGCMGNNHNPLYLFRNQSDFDLDNTGRGGGIYVAGDASSVEVYNGYFYGNFGSFGGALAVADEGDLLVQSIYRIDGQNIPCWQAGQCTVFEENFARTTGGVLQGTDVGLVKIENAVIKNSSAPFAAVIDANNTAQGLDNQIELIGNLMHQNGTNQLIDTNDQTLISAIDGVQVKLLHNTLADNDMNSSIIYNADASIVLHASIIHENQAIPVMDLFSGNNVGGEYVCVMAHELNSLPSASLSLALNPQFVDRNAGNYQLNSATSIGIDFCPDLTAMGMDSLDLMGNQRGWDDVVATNTHGVFDVGAYESYQNDIIFAEGFE